MRTLIFSGFDVVSGPLLVDLDSGLAVLDTWFVLVGYILSGSPLLLSQKSSFQGVMPSDLKLFRFQVGVN